MVTRAGLREPQNSSSQNWGLQMPQKMGVGVLLKNRGHSRESGDREKGAAETQPLNRREIKEGGNRHDLDPHKEGLALLCHGVLETLG